MLSEGQARKVVGKKLRIILPVTTFYTDDFLLLMKIYAEFFSFDEVNTLKNVLN